MSEWYFASQTCSTCKESLPTEKVANPVLVTTPVVSEPDAPKVYADRCPKCHRFNLLAAWTAPEPAEPPVTEEEPPPTSAEPKKGRKVKDP